VTFNFLEAKRRATKSISIHDHNQWLALSIDAGKMLDNILGLQTDRNTNTITAANNFQALSVMFAIIGNQSRAYELLRRAELVAKTLNRTVRIFSVMDYETVDREKFSAQNLEMLQALERGELWDGMKIPAAHS
jgi:hypothetical protein